MFDKLKALMGNNHLRELLGGRLVLTEDVVNRFFKTWLPAGIDSLELAFRESEVSVEAEGKIENEVSFYFKGGLGVSGLVINKTEQTAWIAPAAPVHIETGHQKLNLEFKSGSGVVRELETLAGLLPEDIRQALVFEEERTRILLHKVPQFSAELEKFLKKLPILSNLGVDLLDYVQITDVKFGEQTITIKAKRV